MSLPLILGGAGPEIMDKALLSELGVRICLQGHQPFAAGIQSVHNTLKALRDGVAPSQLQGVADGELMNRVTRNTEYTTSIDDFLHTSKES